MPVSVVAAVVALHTVGWIGGDVIDWITVTDTLAGAAGSVVGSLSLVAVTSAVGVLSAVSTTPSAVAFFAAVAGLRGAVIVPVVGLAGGALGQFRADDAGAAPVAVGD